MPEYLIDNGYNVIPVNPKTSEILGKKSYGSVAEGERKSKLWMFSEDQKNC